MIRVAIIGGGCAGLAAAETLLRNGQEKIEVVLIDAFNRLGGRAWTDSSQGFPFDFGPQFIQDPGINPWLGIAKFLGFETVQSDPGTQYRVFNGAWANLEEAPGGMTDHLDTSYETAKKFENMSPIRQCFVPNENSCLALGSASLGSIGESVEPWQYIASDHARQETPPNAGHGVVYVTKGLGTLVETFGLHLQKQYRELLTTRTSKVVTCVHWDPRRGKLEVLADDESLCTADYCIVSVPCSVVPRIAFIPPLEQKRVVANGYIQLGSYKKIAFKPQTMPEDIEVPNQYYLYDDIMKGCWQYFRLPTAEDALVGVASGNFAARLDKMAPLEAVQAFIRALENSYGPIVPSTNVLFTNWSEQQHIWGAYSYTRYDGGDANDPTAFEARVRIGQPHAVGRILFAGEATWTQAYGTIHGAYFSGERAAREILNSVGSSSIPISI